MSAYKHGTEEEALVSNGSDDIRNQRGEENLILGIFLVPEISGALVLVNPLWERSEILSASRLKNRNKW
jgi:hypothetical protein